MYFFQGRVVALPHERFMEVEAVGPSTNKFVENAINWLAKKNEVKIASNDKRQVSKYTDSLKVVSPKDLASNKDVNVYYVKVDSEFDEESIKAIQEFVENGGGLLIAGHCYGCLYDNLKPADLPGNK